MTIVPNERRLGEFSIRRTPERFPTGVLFKPVSVAATSPPAVVIGVALVLSTRSSGSPEMCPEAPESSV